MTRDSSSKPAFAYCDVVRLLATVAEKGGRPETQKRRLARGLAKLVDADRWAWSVMRGYLPGREMEPVSLVHNLDTRQFAGWIAAGKEAGDLGFDAVLARKLARAKRHITRLRGELIDDQAFAAVPAFGRHVVGNGLKHSLFSAKPLSEPGMASVLVLHREGEKPPFGPPEARLAHAVMGGAGWLHDGEPGIGTLPPRLRAVLTHLIDGEDPKRMAWHLDVTAETVRSYIKRIYRHFGVNSRAELMYRFMDPSTNQRPGVEALSPRLRAVLDMLVDGRTAPQIAEMMGLSPHTVRSYVKDIYRLLGVNSRHTLMRCLADGAAAGDGAPRSLVNGTLRRAGGGRRAPGARW